MGDIAHAVTGPRRREAVTVDILERGSASSEEVRPGPGEAAY